MLGRILSWRPSVAEYEALFSEGTKLTIEADATRVEGNLVLFEQQMDGHLTTVCMLSIDQLLFVIDTRADVTIEEPEYDDEDDE